MVIYERKGLQRNPSSPSLCGGLARPELPVIGAVLSCIRARTYYREPLPEVRGRGGKDAVARQIRRGGGKERKRGVLHTIAARSLTDASQAPGNFQKRFTCTTKANVGLAPALACQNTTSPSRFKSTVSVGKVGILRFP